MSGINDTDYLAAVMALADSGPRPKVQADEVARLLDIEYVLDLWDDMADLAERGLLHAEASGTLRLNLREMEYEERTRLMWSITAEGRFEVYRR